MHGYDPNLDLDTNTKGTDGPFEYWESDHTALVHVLWAARSRGLTLDGNADEIARMILRSRWLTAQKDAHLQRHDEAVQHQS